MKYASSIPVAGPYRKKGLILTNISPFFVLYGYFAYFRYKLLDLGVQGIC